mmetsp:Transcript_44335/g.65256  ORF Transcript_44335/g.65256 Transcript_44335/m.65256 type:complete len:161 (+) Transcript_44335:120-602(+)|eukprot:CAMPEP_0195518590 /NCGR_PEP_ID=MMETSP0794_2-20130614/13280_1 /TAXON_ID=515487 /ORGANISM="Stephanopyxis turris, Strain CCMP 815" /LENGTH=160 /DNA_ID=CAMNT_0040647593 /DNA_START=103 /DNA_END=585 /DNA_ORIENTATION=+
MTDPQTPHQIPKEGMCCLCTMEDITTEDLNYVEFQSYPSMKWKPALFELCVVQQLLDTQFTNYINKVKKTDCQAELRRLLKDGPPIYISDKHAFPLDEGDSYVINLWFAKDGEERSAKLTGAVDGAEREELWESLKDFIVVEGKEEGDGDDDDEEEEKKR